MRFELGAVGQIDHMRGNIVDRGRVIVARRVARQRRILRRTEAAGDAGVGGRKRQQRRSMRLRLRLAPEFFDDRLPLVRGERHHRRLGALRHVADRRRRRLRRRRSRPDAVPARSRPSEPAPAAAIGSFGFAASACFGASAGFGACRELRSFPPASAPRRDAACRCARAATPAQLERGEAVLERNGVSAERVAGAASSAAAGRSERVSVAVTACGALRGGNVLRTPHHGLHRSRRCRAADRGWPRKYWHRRSRRSPARGCDGRAAEKTPRAGFPG